MPNSSYSVRSQRIEKLAAVTFENGHRFFETANLSSLFNPSRIRAALHALALWDGQPPTDAEILTALGPDFLDLPSVNWSGDQYFDLFHIDSDLLTRFLALIEMTNLTPKEVEDLVNLLPPDAPTRAPHTRH